MHSPRILAFAALLSLVAAAPVGNPDAGKYDRIEIERLSFHRSLLMKVIAIVDRQPEDEQFYAIISGYDLHRRDAAPEAEPKAGKSTELIVVFTLSVISCSRNTQRLKTVSLKRRHTTSLVPITTFIAAMPPLSLRLRQVSR